MNEREIVVVVCQTNKNKLTMDYSEQASNNQLKRSSTDILASQIRILDLKRMCASAHKYSIRIHCSEYKCLLHVIKYYITLLKYINYKYYTITLSLV